MRGTSPSSSRSRHLRLATVVALALVAAITVTVVVMSDDADEPVTLAGPAAGAGPGWEVLPPSPLSPRHAMTVVAVGDEALVLGGTDQPLCPPNAGCVGPGPEQLLFDAAAYDPASRTWRRLADVPDAQLQAVGVIGDVAYATAQSPDRLFAYDVSDDRWTQLPTPPASPGQLYRDVTTAGDVLLSSVGEGTGPDLVLDVREGRWEPLPASPLGAGSGRRFVWTGTSAVLFDHELVAQPGAGGEPWFNRYAELDLASRTWGPVKVIRDALPNDLTWDGERVLSMGSFPETINGGGPPPGDYGRDYPTSGYLDLATAGWSPLPAGRPSPTASRGAPAAFSTRFKPGGSAVLDTRTRAWLVPPAPPVEVGTSVGSTWVGDRLFAWGGGTPDASTTGDRTLIATGAVWTP